MERSNLFNHLLRIFDEGLSMKTTELEYGTLEVTVENRSQDKKITFLAKGMEDAKQKAAEWQVGQMLLNCDDLRRLLCSWLKERNLKRKCQMDKNFRSCFCCVHFLEIQITSIGNVLKCKKGSTTKVQGKRVTEIAARCKNYKACGTR